jgi:hypothetical protein
MMKTVISAVLAAVLAGALGFYGGVTYQKSQTQSAFAGRIGGPNGNGAAGRGENGGDMASGPRGINRQGGSVATGTVLAQDAKTITVKTADGGSKTVFLSANTRYTQQQQLTAADLKVGDQVMAAGQSANGGIDARSITVVPPGSDFGFGGGGPGGPGGDGQDDGGAPPPGP